MAGKRALITGSEGFVARTLCAHLSGEGFEVLGCDLAVPDSASDRLQCDITDEGQVQALFQWAGECDYLFHLAAMASVSQSLKGPASCMRANAEGTVLLCEGMKRSMPEARLLFVGSAEVYGRPDYLPMDESHPLNPANPYAISKMAGEFYCRYMNTGRDLDVVMMRPFNHSGPGQSSRFVLSSFARQIAEIEKGQHEPVLRVGNLAARRDFCHVKDVVRAYLQVVLSAKSGEVYNVCSGEAYEIREALEMLRTKSTAEFSIERDPERYRPVDVPELRGSYAKIREEIGWEPELSFDKLLEDLLTYWRDM